jgi:hypothetical protein
MFTPARFMAVAFSAAALAAAPAAAVVSFDFSGPSGTTNVASVSRSSGSVNVTATALNFTVAPGGINNLSQFTSGTRQIQQIAPGIGVNGGASSPQIDTNQPANREAILLSANTGFNITGMRLSRIDANDTLALFGVNADDSLSLLGYNNRIINGFGGQALSFTNSGANGGTTTFTVAPTGRFDRFVFTTAVGGDVLFGGDLGQGYTIDSITGYVPEPATWAMLILGFGLVGFSARRRARSTTVLA